MSTYHFGSHEILPAGALSGAVDRLLARDLSVAQEGGRGIVASEVTITTELVGPGQPDVVDGRVEPGLVWQDLAYPAESVAAYKEQLARRGVESALASEERVSLVSTEEPAPTFVDFSAVTPGILAPAAVPKAEKSSNPKVVLREATADDIDRLVELDLKMFKGAYGEKLPTAEEDREMFTRRYENVQNGRGLMFVCEVDGRVEGFATYFKTNKSFDDFTSWEESTSNGTLDGVTDPNGRFAYVVNLTVGSKGSAVKARERLTAGMMAYAVRDGIKQAYFVSRLPQFAKWASSRNIDVESCTEEDLDRVAQEYSELRRPEHKRKGAVKQSFSRAASALRKIHILPAQRPARQVPYDYELRMYESMGFERGRLVKGGFGDPESLNYGVIFRIKVPAAESPMPVRAAVAGLLSFIGRHQRLAAKIF